MRVLLYICIAVIILAISLIGTQLSIIGADTRKMSYDSKPFVRDDPSARLKILFAGDSTALGTGAASNTHSVAGWFGRDFPDARIDNDSFNGRTLSQLEARFPKAPARFYNLVVLQIGANDIMKFTPFGKIDKEITAVIAKAKNIGQNIVILHSGNVGLAPVFIWPFNWIMTERARAMRRLYIQKARQYGILYVDLFTERNNDLFLKDIPKYYAPDHLHPSGAGYHWWYERIRATLAQAGTIL